MYKQITFTIQIIQDKTFAIQVINRRKLCKMKEIKLKQKLQVEHKGHKGYKNLI